VCEKRKRCAACDQCKYYGHQVMLGHNGMDKQVDCNNEYEYSNDDDGEIVCCHAMFSF
jgi:hypothetical protein